MRPKHTHVLSLFSVPYEFLKSRKNAKKHPDENKGKDDGCEKNFFFQNAVPGFCIKMINILGRFYF